MTTERPRYVWFGPDMWQCVNPATTTIDKIQVALETLKHNKKEIEAIIKIQSDMHHAGPDSNKHFVFVADEDEDGNFVFKYGVKK